MNKSTTAVNGYPARDPGSSFTWRRALYAPLSLFTYSLHILFWNVQFNSSPEEFANYQWALRSVGAFYLILGLTLIGLQAWMTILQKRLKLKIEELDSKMKRRWKDVVDDIVPPERVSFLYASGIIMITLAFWFF